MKKIIYIITRNNELLQKNIDKLSNLNAKLKIINTCLTFYINPKYNNIDVVHLPENTSLSKLYNHCILDGFKNLKNPNYNIVSIIRDNVLINVDNYNTQIVELHKKYSFICSSHIFMSFTPESICAFGIFDEIYYSKLFIYDIIIRSIIYKVESSIDSILYNINLVNKSEIVKKQYHIIDNLSLHEKDYDYFKYKWE